MEKLVKALKAEQTLPIFIHSHDTAGLAAMVYKYSMGQPMMYPRNDLTYAENFLHMMFNTPCEILSIALEIGRAHV